MGGVLDAFQDPQSLQAALRDPPLIESYDRAVASLLQSKFTSAEDLNNFANTVILESLAIEESVQPLVPYILAALEARRRKNARILASREEVATDSENPHQHRNRLLRLPFSLLSASRSLCRVSLFPW